MKIVWFSWKDIRDPLAGGAELITHNQLKRLALAGHDVTLLTRRPKGALPEASIDGYKIVRRGSRVSVYLRQYFYFRRNLRGKVDFVIEEVNTIPFFAVLYCRAKSILMFHQLAREVWFYELPWPFSQIGYWLEPLYLKLLSRHPVIAVSESTKADLAKQGFMPADIHIVRNGIDPTPIANLGQVKKLGVPTILALGSLRPMKRTGEVVRAFEIVAAAIPRTRLTVAGSQTGRYARKVLSQIATSPYRDRIDVLGTVSTEQKLDLMRKSHVLAVASTKEGWGLTVTEANSQGTPAVGYDIDGLRDSIKNGRTGLVVRPDPDSLAQALIELLTDTEGYNKLRRAAWSDSQQYTYAQSYEDFWRALTTYARR